MHSERPNLVEVAVEEEAMAMVQAMEVAEEVTIQEPLADTIVLHQIAKADVAIVELHTRQDSVLHMTSHATTVVNPIITPGTMDPDEDCPHLVTGCDKTCMIWNQQKNSNMTLSMSSIK